ncbi:MAG: hypothetical protein GYA34_04090 [Chloroflexi bacterium]|nr:hypothetical protein [Chloroflexota bacterium]
MPGHILASMRLHLASPFVFNPPEENFFAQVLHLRHGYSTILIPWLLYELFYGLFHITINEISLVYVNSLIGLFSLISIYWFIKENFNPSMALLGTALMAIIPIHIGLSRAHVGFLLFYLTFFYLSLAFLHKYMVNKQSIWLKGYFVTTCIYIGCDNLFLVGLFLQIVYLFLISENKTLSQFTNEIKQIYLSPNLLFILLPVSAYTTFSIISIKTGVESGYFLRLYEKINSNSYEFNPIKVFIWAISLIGPPVGIFVVAAIDCIKTKCNQNRKVIFLMILFLVYFLLLITNTQTEKNYVLFLALPIAIISSIFLIKHPIWMYATIICTLIYAFAVVYRVNIGFPTITNYGSLDYKEANNDFGIKTLGYLVRSGELEISRAEKEGDAIGLFLDYEGAQYYIGNNFNAWAATDIRERKYEQYQSYILAYQTNNERADNQSIQELAKKEGLALIGKITKNNQPIILLYSNLRTQNQRIFPVEIYNKKFDQKYGNLDWLPNF